MNIAARMGSWSTRHRKKAIFGWLLFAIIATVIGSSLGTKQITNAEGTNGQAAKAEQIIADSGIKSAASENVLVQTRNGKPDDAALRAVSEAVVNAVTATHLVTDVHSALDADGRPYLSKDGHSMLVSFDLTGDSTTAEHRVQP